MTVCTHARKHSCTSRACFLHMTLAATPERTCASRALTSAFNSTSRCTTFFCPEIAATCPARTRTHTDARARDVKRAHVSSRAHAHAHAHAHSIMLTHHDGSAPKPSLASIDIRGPVVRALQIHLLTIPAYLQVFECVLCMHASCLAHAMYASDNTTKTCKRMHNTNAECGAALVHPRPHPQAPCAQNPAYSSLSGPTARSSPFAHCMSHGPLLARHLPQR